MMLRHCDNLQGAQRNLSGWQAHWIEKFSIWLHWSVCLLWVGHPPWHLVVSIRNWYHWECVSAFWIHRTWSLANQRTWWIWYAITAVLSVLVLVCQEAMATAPGHNRVIWWVDQTCALWSLHLVSSSFTSQWWTYLCLPPRPRVLCQTQSAPAPSIQIPGVADNAAEAAIEHE